MKALIIIILCLISIISWSQTFQGLYKENSDFLNFSDDSVKFKFESNGGLIINELGEGNYRLIDEFLIIKASDYKGLKSVVHKSFNKNDRFELKILNKHGNPLPGATILFLDQSEKVIDGLISDNLGQANYQFSTKIKKIKIVFIGYDTIEFECDQFNSFTIELIDDEIIENQIVVFQVINHDTKSLSLRLLSTNYRSDQNAKELKILLKKTRKYNYRIRNYKT